MMDGKGLCCDNYQPNSGRSRQFKSEALRLWPVAITVIIVLDCRPRIF
jgi:hypothetical protein